MLLILLCGTLNAQKMAKKGDEYYNFRHRISWVASDVFAFRMLFAYEHINSSGKLGIRIPVGFGFSANIFDLESPGINTVTGLDVNLYPKTTHQLFNYFYGPALRMGYAQSDIHQRDESVFAGLLLNNGVALNLQNHFFISFYAGGGVKYSYYFNPDSSPEPYHRFYPHGIFGFSFGVNLK